ncbi:hypothetical protein AVEN_234495-1 [Araneus ventricosus]|uniref:Uncharacterized protein n=1 Tax=Araneus ventricosus TaxID=182803 RepID=A0A4Y2AA51_ARAVE|nr:hypothetical protein AVEN_234495-1 [Araneus ventricosus]
MAKLVSFLTENGNLKKQPPDTTSSSRFLSFTKTSQTYGLRPSRGSIPRTLISPPTIQYGFRSSSKFPQDQARSPGLFAKLKIRNLTWEKCKSGSQKTPHETTLVPVFREAKNDLPSQNPSPPFINRSSSPHQASGISFHKSSEGRRPPFILTISSFTKAGFENLLNQNPKNTALSPPRHVGDSVNQRLC